MTKLTIGFCEDILYKFFKKPSFKILSTPEKEV